MPASEIGIEREAACFNGDFVFAHSINLISGQNLGSNKWPLDKNNKFSPEIELLR